MNAPAKSLTVFCDFDGTMTEKDMVVSVCKKFNPDRWQKIVEGIVEKKITVKQGVIDLFNDIPSSEKQAIIDYALKIIEWRAGLQEFLVFCKDNGIQFIVCSGGIDFFLEPLVERFQPYLSRVVSIPSDFSQPTIQLKHTYACEFCGTCKVKVIEEYPNSISILIGDSITDLHGARHANIVFARDRLKGYLDAEKISYCPFETFHDIIAHLNTFGKEPCHAH